MTHLDVKMQNIYAASRTQLVLIDGHNDLPWAHREAFGYDLDRGDIALPQPDLQTDLPRLSRGGVQGQFWSVYVPSTLSEPQAVVATLEQIDFVRRLVSRYDQLALATTADQVKQAVANGRLASLLGIEGGHSIGGSLGVLRQLYNLGARYMTLTHNRNTAWADSATDEPAVGGLSDFGRAVVAEMNRLGMIVDLSHVADATMHDALETTAAPVIFSHSNARAVCDVSRNVPDEVLALVPDNGGMVMATFVPFFVAEPVARWMSEAMELARMRRGNPEGPLDPFEVIRERALSEPPPRATLDDVVMHLDYLREAVGVAHIGIGGDFDGSDHVTVGLEDVASYPRLFDALRARGWSASELDGLAGRNLLRVMRDVEAVGHGCATSA
jgi:membrane dipeptidase